MPVFDPQRTELYASQDLLGAYDAARVGSYLETLDARVYREAVAAGLRVPTTDTTAEARASHDVRITRALQRRLEGHRVVAVMGGHKLDRKSDEYRIVAEVGRELTRREYLIVSGGGPGAMEAAHLGAWTATGSDADLARALAVLAEVPSFPDTKDRPLIRNGSYDMKLVEEIHRWQAPAFTVISSSLRPGTSVGIPTWLYGHEPPTPFATGHAKYFENSLREDGLLAVARYGVIYAKGSAGTLQEVFQDAAQNYYTSVDYFSPMVFLDVGEFWSVTRPVKLLLEGLFDEAGERHLSFVATAAEVIEVVASFNPPTSAAEYSSS